MMIRYKNNIFERVKKNHAGRDFQYLLGSGRVAGQVGMLKYTIGYFRVSFYFRVFPIIPGYIAYIIGYLIFFLR